MMKPLWERLSQEERQVLAFKWIDQSIREDLAHMCERAGRTRTRSKWRSEGDALEHPQRGDSRELIW